MIIRDCIVIKCGSAVHVSGEEMGRGDFVRNVVLGLDDLPTDLRAAIDVAAHWPPSHFKANTLNDETALARVSG